MVTKKAFLASNKISSQEVLSILKKNLFAQEELSFCKTESWMGWYKTERAVMAEESQQAIHYSQKECCIVCNAYVVLWVIYYEITSNVKN